MLSEGKRVCDICGEEIPKGTKFRQNHLPPEAAAMLSDPDDPELRATFTVNPDGTLTLDRCLDCFMDMDWPPGENEIIQ